MELTQPITIHWDLPEDKDAELLGKPLADILACRPLMLQLRDPSLTLCQETVTLLKAATAAPVAVSLTVSPLALDREALALLGELRLKEILLCAPRLAPLKEWFREHGAECPDRVPCGVSFSVTRENWRELPALITWCRAQGIGRLVLPMQRIYHDQPAFQLDLSQQQHLAQALRESGGSDGIELTIHDPFLWRPFHPGVPFPQGGCQAANTMLAIAPDATVYPCPTLPLALGNLADTSLKEIVRSLRKKEVRGALLHCPAECADCSELTDCRGGCRGRGYQQQGSLDGADPACR